MSKLNDRLVISQKKLTVLLGGLAIAMPIILYLGNLFVHGNVDTLSSMSAYYYSPMRDVFVGILFAMGVFLVTYEGYSNGDRLLSTIGGILVIIVALAPTNHPGETADLLAEIHTYAAAAFYGVLTIFSLFRFTKSSGNKTTKKKIRNTIYIICGIVMAVTLVTLTYTSVAGIELPLQTPTFWMEYTANTAFGIAFLVKGEGIFFLNDDPIENWNPWEIFGSVIAVLLLVSSITMASYLILF